MKYLKQLNQGSWGTAGDASKQKEVIENGWKVTEVDKPCYEQSAFGLKACARNGYVFNLMKFTS